MLLLWLWVACVALLYDMCVDVPQFDRVRPSAAWYRQAREDVHGLFGAGGTDSHDEARPVDQRSPLIGAPRWTVGEARRALLSSRSSVRLHLLRELVREDVRDGRILAEVIDVARGGTAPDAWYARVILMRVSHHRAAVEDLARLVGETRSKEYRELLRQFDAAHADMLVACADAERDTRSTALRAQMHGVLAALAAKPENGVAEVCRMIEAAPPADLPGWLTVAAAMRPVSVALGETLLRRFDAGGAEEKRAILANLGRASTDLTAIGRSVAQFVASRMDAAGPAELEDLLLVLGNANDVSTPVLEALMRVARRGGTSGQSALETLAALGPKASAASSELLRLPSGDPVTQHALTVAVIALQDPGSLPYLADRLTTGSDQERTEILDHLHLFEGAEATLLEKVQAMTAGVGVCVPASLRCLARLDPSAADTRVAEALERSLSDPRVEVRAAGLAASDELDRLPAQVLGEVVACLRHDEPGTRAAAERVIIRLGRHGAAGKPYLDVLLGVATGSPASAPGFKAALLETLAAIDADNPRVRSLLITSLRDEHLALRKAALSAFARVQAPTADDYIAVAGTLREGRLLGLRQQVLAQPAWRRVGEDHDIKTGVSVPDRAD